MHLVIEIQLSQLFIGAMSRREYDDRVREVEKASFIPSVFATPGGMGKEATVFYHRLANLLSCRNNVMYGTIPG